MLSCQLGQAETNFSVIWNKYTDYSWRNRICKYLLANGAHFCSIPNVFRSEQMLYCLWISFSKCIFFKQNYRMRRSWNGNIFRVTGHLWGDPPVTDRFPSQRSMTRSFDLRLNKCLSKQPRRRWFETPSRSLWRHCNVIIVSGNSSTSNKWQTITREKGHFVYQRIYASPDPNELT